MPTTPTTPPSRDRLFPSPVRNPESEPYFAAANERRLLVRHCLDCAKAHHYPRSFCPFCHSIRLEWRDFTGTATLYSFSVTRKPGPVPYAIAYVTLDGLDISMMTNIVDCDLDELRIGQRLRLSFKACEDGSLLPVFTPTDDISKARDPGIP
jgi:uncharacterized protein